MCKVALFLLSLTLLASCQSGFFGQNNCCPQQSCGPCGPACCCGCAEGKACTCAQEAAQR